MRISVVMPAYNAAATIRQQLDALVVQQLDEPWEIVVADNGSTDDTASIVADYSQRHAAGPAVRMVRADHRQGANAARNAGSAAARGELIAYVDADDVATPGWLRAIVTGLASFDCVGGRLISKGGAGYRRVPEGIRRHRDFLPYASTANSAVRFAVYDQIGGFDESFTHGGDDVEFFWRAQLHGFTLGYAPEAVVEYRLRPDAASERRQMWNYARCWPLLYSNFRHDGMPRSSIRRALRDWAWLLARLPVALRHDSRYGVMWRNKLIMRVGRLVGSFKHRVLYP